MKVYALVGKSGTGKSYQAINLCKELNIEAIIDDGLFIFQNRVEAGISAKRQSTTIGAIKTALFSNPEHQKAVRKRIKEVKPASLLVIGTSDRMIEKIGESLHLPKPVKTIYIEEITTPEERDVADKQRHIQGKHIIPVPTLQLKRDFAGYFMDPLRIFRGIAAGGKAQFSEKTVVRPTFSYMGEFYISEKVLMDIASCVAAGSPGIAEVLRTYQNTEPDSLSVTTVVLIKEGYEIWETAMDFQAELASKIEFMTAFNISNVDIEVKGLA